MTSLAPDLSLSAIGANPDESKRTLPVLPVEAPHAVAIAELENGP
jgi:hypothetical protein